MSNMRLLTLPEAAAWVGCSTRTLRRRIRAGELGVFRDRGLLRIPERALTDYLSARTLPSHTNRRPAAPTALGNLPPPAAAHRLWDFPDPLDLRPVSSNDRHDPAQQGGTR